MRTIYLLENGILATSSGRARIALADAQFRGRAQPGAGSAFVQEGFRRSTLVLDAPIDDPARPDRIAVAVTPAPEGSLTLLSATASDTEGPVVVAWDLDGDGVGDAEGESVWIDVPDGPSFTSIGDDRHRLRRPIDTRQRRGRERQRGTNRHAEGDRTGSERPRDGEGHRSR